MIRMQPFRRGRTLISILGFLIGMILVLASDGVCIAGCLFKEKHQCGFCDANECLAFWGQFNQAAFRNELFRLQVSLLLDICRSNSQ